MGVAMAQKHKNAAKSAKRQPRVSARGSAPLPVAAAGTAAGVAGVASAGSTVAGAAGTCARLPLGASLSIREVSECAAQLKALFAAGSAEVDAHELQSIDTAGLQLLLAAAAAAQRRGLKL